MESILDLYYPHKWQRSIPDNNQSYQKRQTRNYDFHVYLAG